MLYYLLAGYLLASQKPGLFKIKYHWPLAIFAVSLISLLVFLKIGVGEYFGQKALIYANQDLSLSLLYSKHAYELNPFMTKNLRQLLFFEEEILRNQPGIEKRNELLLSFANHLLILEKIKVKDIEDLKALTGGYMRLVEFSRGNYDKAFFYGKELIKFDPTGPGSFDSLGLVYLDSKDYQKALDIFNYIIRDLKPDYPFAYFHLGETYRQMGEPEKSLDYYVKAAELGWDGAITEIIEAKQEIEVKK